MQLRHVLRLDFQQWRVTCRAEITGIRRPIAWTWILRPDLRSRRHEETQKDQNCALHTEAIQQVALPPSAALPLAEGETASVAKRRAIAVPDTPSLMLHHNARKRAHLKKSRWDCQNARSIRKKLV